MPLACHAAQLQVPQTRSSLTQHQIVHRTVAACHILRRRAGVRSTAARWSTRNLRRPRSTTTANSIKSVTEQLSQQASVCGITSFFASCSSSIVIVSCTCNFRLAASCGAGRQMESKTSTTVFCAFRHWSCAWPSTGRHSWQSSPSHL